MLAVAVCGPASIVPLTALIVIVRTWFVLTAFVSVAGVIWMFASTQTLLALPLPPAAVLIAVFVVRVMTWPLTGMSDVAETTVVPTAAEVIVTVHVAVAAPPVEVQGFGPTNEPGPLTIEAVAVCGPASIGPWIAFTVILSTWFVLTALVSFAGVIWMLALTQTLLALSLPPAAEFTTVLVVRVMTWPLTGMSDVAETTVVPTAAEVMVTVQVAVGAPPV